MKLPSGSAPHGRTGWKVGTHVCCETGRCRCRSSRRDWGEQRSCAARWSLAVTLMSGQEPDRRKVQGWTAAGRPRVQTRVQRAQGGEQKRVITPHGMGMGSTRACLQGRPRHHKNVTHVHETRTRTRTGRGVAAERGRE